MTRLTAVLLAALLTFTVTAAPAPEPKPWVTGWDKPIDPSGDCRFRGDGDKLTLTVPGNDHELDVPGGRLRAPRLLRDVAGDFIVQVRVEGDFRLSSGDGFRRAGLLLTDGETFLRVERSACRSAGETVSSVWAGHHILGQPGGGVAEHTDVALERPGYVRLARRKDQVRASYSEDGEKWTLLLPAGWKLPEKVRIGVVAEMTDSGEFKPVFDMFKLSRPGE
jgi:regulation of enolase protein 1 (concanavalin A-like superfamily)